MPSAVQAVIYSRISHDPFETSAGVERQEADCYAFAQRRGWEVVTPVYRENDTPASTRSRAPRPVYERMLDDLRAGRAQVLLCYSTSRLTRRPRDYEMLIELVKATGLQIVTVVSGAVDLTTADGRAVARVLAAMDSAESERLGERVARQALQRAEQGLWHGGPVPPFGYRFTKGPDGRRTLAVAEDTAKLLREACTRINDGSSLAAIRRDWNARGLTSSAGKQWRSQAIRRMLVKPAGAGLIERDGRLLAGNWTAVLGRAEWEQARGRLLDPTRDTRTFQQRAVRHPLRGLLICGLCGSRMTSNPLRNVPSFMCSDRVDGGCGHIRIKADDVERFLRELIAARQHELGQPTRPRTRAERHSHDQLLRLHDDYYDGLLTREDFLRQRTRLLGHGRLTRGEVTTSEQLLTPAALEIRELLLGHLVRVIVNPHPVGMPTRATTWPRRAETLRARLTCTWINDRPDGADSGDEMAASVSTSTLNDVAAARQPAGSHALVDQPVPARDGRGWATPN